MDLMPESVQEPTEIGKLEATADDYGAESDIITCVVRLRDYDHYA